MFDDYNSKDKEKRHGNEYYTITGSLEKRKRKWLLIINLVSSGVHSEGTSLRTFMHGPSFRIQEEEVCVTSTYTKIVVRTG